MIEEFQNKKGAYIKKEDRVIELHDYEIRDLITELNNLVVDWDKSISISNKSLNAFSDFKNHIVVRIGEDEFGMSTIFALKLWKELEESIKESI